jgi:TonB family protein
MVQNPRKFTALKMPSYPGGRKAFQEFMRKNVRYPKEAEEAKIEGTVIVGYQITDNGMVLNPYIIKGLGYGCDEEAIRVIGLLRYEKVRNRRVRVKLTTKATIHFSLSKVSVSYSIAEDKTPEKKAAGAEPKSGGTSYSYTIEY